MRDSRALPPARVMVGLGVTVLALLVLGVRACSDGDPEVAPSDPGPSTSQPTSSVASSDAADAATTTVSIQVLPDWYPKQSSRYSDRQPAVTVTTLPPTTTTEPGED
jgi:hypothetical protein